MKMNIRFNPLFVVGVLLLLAGPVRSYGVLIDFDDLPTQIDPSERCADWFPGSNCVDDQYLHPGVRFEGLMVYSPAGHYPFTELASGNAVVNWSGVRFNLFFSDWARPDYVSFYAWTRMFGGVFARAYDENGAVIADVQAEPEVAYPDEDHWRYTLPPTHIAISAQDISRVEIQGLPNRRGNLHMDICLFRRHAADGGNRIFNSCIAAHNWVCPISPDTTRQTPGYLALMR
ncbi:hypothetical protein ACFOZ5_05820 [Marinobacter lacisalsi]|uniref:Uncharacterized protein n=1 Tax=Marinobacter lacisalsi TaxID=475979 RepID=A0ABV8QGH9_9GAMM